MRLPPSQHGKPLDTYGMKRMPACPFVPGSRVMVSERVVGARGNRGTVLGISADWQCTKGGTWGWRVKIQRDGLQQPDFFAACYLKPA